METTGICNGARQRVWISWCELEGILYKLSNCREPRLELKFIVTIVSTRPIFTRLHGVLNQVDNIVLKGFWTSLEKRKMIFKQTFGMILYHKKTKCVPQNESVWTKPIKSGLKYALIPRSCFHFFLNIQPLYDETQWINSVENSPNILRNTGLSARKMCRLHVNKMERLCLWGRSVNVTVHVEVG